MLQRKRPLEVLFLASACLLAQACSSASPSAAVPDTGGRGAGGAEGAEPAADGGLDVVAPVDATDDQATGDVAEAGVPPTGAGDNEAGAVDVAVVADAAPDDATPPSADASGGADALGAGGPIRLVTNTLISPQGPLSRTMAVDATNLYWLAVPTGQALGRENNGNTAIMRMPLGGGTPVVVASDPLGISGFVLVGDTLVWTARGFGNGVIMVLPMAPAGGTAIPLVSKLDRPTTLAADASNAYYVAAVGGGVRAILKVAIAGGTPTMVTPLSALESVSELTVDSSSLYWLESRAIWKIALAGGMPTMLTATTTAPSSLVLDATHAYWSEGLPLATIMKVPLAGGTAVPVVATQARPSDLKIDGDKVYWTSWNNPTGSNALGAVLRADLAGGGTPVVLAEGALTVWATPLALVLRGPNVYWTYVGYGTTEVTRRSGVVGLTPK